MAAPRSLFSVVALCILAGCAVSRGQVHEHVDGEMCKHDTIQADRMKDPVYREEMWRFNQQFLETEKEIIRSFPHLRKRSGTCDTLFRVPVIWHVLYHNTDDRVPIERIDREMDGECVQTKTIQIQSLLRLTVVLKSQWLVISYVLVHT